MSTQSLLSKLSSPLGGSFSKNVGVLLSGTVGTQLLCLGAAPFLTRSYSTFDFGEFAAFVAIVAVSGILATMRFELAIPLPDEDETARSLLAAGLISVFSICLALTGAFHLFSGFIIAEQEFFRSFSTVRLIPLGILLTSSFQLLRYWEIRKSRFRSVSLAVLAVNAVAVGLQLLMKGATGAALIHGYLAGNAVGVLLLLFGSHRELKLFKLQFSMVKSAVIRYRKFPMFTTVEGFVNSLGTQLTPVLLSSFLGQSSAGIYSIAQRYAAAPTTMISNAVTQVFIRDGSSALKEGGLEELAWTVFRTLSRFGAGFAMISFVCAPEMFALILGDTWRASGRIAQLLAVWLYSVVVCSSLSGVLVVREQQAIALKFQGLLSALRFVALLLGLVYGTMEDAILYFSATSAICWGTLGIWLLTDLGIPARAVVAFQLRVFLIGAVFAAPCAIYKMAFDSSDVGVSLSCVISLLVYGLWAKRAGK